MFEFLWKIYQIWHRSLCSADVLFHFKLCFQRCFFRFIQNQTRQSFFTFFFLVFWGNRKQDVSSAISWITFRNVNRCRFRSDYRFHSSQLFPHADTWEHSHQITFLLLSATVSVAPNFSSVHATNRHAKHFTFVRSLFFPLLSVSIRFAIVFRVISICDLLVSIGFLLLFLGINFVGSSFTLNESVETNKSFCFKQKKRNTNFSRFSV